MKLNTIVLTALGLAACAGMPRKPFHPIITTGAENARRLALKAIGASAEGMQPNGDMVACESVHPVLRDGTTSRGFSETAAIAAAQDLLGEKCAARINEERDHCGYKGTGEADDEDPGFFIIEERFLCGKEAATCRAKIAPVAIESSIAVDQETQEITACARTKLRDLQKLEVEEGAISGSR